MKNIYKFLLLSIFSMNFVNSALAESVYIPPSKTKPDISRLKADPGCKYIVEYNEFVREYSVNQICQGFNFNNFNTQINVEKPTAQNVTSPTSIAQQVTYITPTYTYPNYTTVNNNYSTNWSWIAAFPVFNNFLSNFNSWYSEPEIAAHEVPTVSWYEEYVPDWFSVDYSVPNSFNVNYNSPTTFNVDYNSPSTFNVDYNEPTSFNF